MTNYLLFSLGAAIGMFFSLNEKEPEESTTRRVLVASVAGIVYGGITTIGWRILLTLLLGEL